MSEEVLIPKMTRISEKQRYRIKIPFINLVFIFCAILFIICSTFVNIDLRHYILPSGILSGRSFSAEDFIFSFSWIPQIPAIMFITSVLGKKMSVICVILYILAGLCGLPLFALGGGIKYIAQFGFGYILAYIPAVVIAGRFLQEKYDFPNMIKAAVCGVLIVHFCGILYMIMVALFRHAGSSFIGGWIASQSGLKIIYDIIFSFLLILIGKYLNEGLKYISR